MRSHSLSILGGIMIAVSPTTATTLQIDANAPSGVTLAGWQGLAASDTALGDSFSRNDLESPGGGTASINIDAVGGIALDTRDRNGLASDPPPSPEYDMWRDFVFGNGSNVTTEGIDVVITGLLPGVLYPVRIWSFDRGSTGDRVSTWNGTSYTFNGSNAGPADLVTNVIELIVSTDAAGELRLEGRANPPAGNTSPHHVFINGLEIGDPLTGPIDIQISSTRLNQNSPAATVVGTLTSTHSLPNQTYIYSLVAGNGDTDNTRFDINGDKLVFIGTVSDVAVGGTVSVRVRSTDLNVQSFEKAFAITIVKDTDNDLLDDDWELTYFPTLATANGAGNNDNDSLDNAAELTRGTNPTLGDTDGDGLMDHVENNSRTYVSPTDTGSDPLAGDTDQDTFSDAEEVSGVNGFVTNPNRNDTDNDNFSDDTEIGRGTDPTSAASAPDIMELLVAYWPLDQMRDVGGILLTPELKDERDFTVVGMDATAMGPGRIDQAMTFDGLDDMLVRVSAAGDALPIAQHKNWTVSLWVKCAGTGQTDLRFFSEASTTNAAAGNPLLNLGTHVTATDGGIDIYLRTPGLAAQHVVTNRKPLDGVDWHHVALVKNGDLSTVALYIDGTLENVTIPYVSPWDGTIDSTTVGGILRAAASHWFVGSVDEVSVWRAHLSAAQVAALASAIGPLLESPPLADFVVTSFTRNGATGEVSLTWGSEFGANYSIEYSQSFTSWVSLPTLIPSQGQSTNHVITSGLPAGVPMLLRVRREP